MYSEIVGFIKNLYPKQDFIPLHAPMFNGNEKNILMIVSIQLLFLL